MNLYEVEPHLRDQICYLYVHKIQGGQIFCTNSFNNNITVPKEDHKTLIWEVYFRNQQYFDRVQIKNSHEFLVFN